MIKTLLTILSLYICNNIVHSCYFCLGEKAESKVENTALSQRLTTTCTYYQQRFIANADFSSSHEQHEHTDFPISPS